MEPTKAWHHTLAFAESNFSSPTVIGVNAGAKVNITMIG
jgi:hypothetical protein